MRLIDGDALMAELKRAMRSWMEDDDFEKGVRTGITRGINGAMHAPTISGWIPVTERLPEKSTRCLVTWKSMFHTIEIDVAKYGRMFLSERKGLGFYLHGSDVDADITDEVIAWMELPPAYKEETDE